MGMYSLKYFEDLFGTRNAAFWELVAALAEELEGYAAELPAAVAEGLVATARLVHDHRPAVTNLGLVELPAAEMALRSALAAGDTQAVQEWTTRVAHEARTAAEALISERLRACPGLP